jgi:hypothetical protein
MLRHKIASTLFIVCESFNSKTFANENKTNNPYILAVSLHFNPHPITVLSGRELTSFRIDGSVCNFKRSSNNLTVL